MAKKILLVDDSALMRRVLCDIINNDERFQVVDRATNGLEALELLSRNTYDGVVLDVNMPRMNGLELLKKLQQRKISAKVMMASTDTRDGAKVTLDALELGALDFVHKPNSAIDCREQTFQTELLRTLSVVTESKPPVFESREKILDDRQTTGRVLDIVKKRAVAVPGEKIVAIASSTGGPKALQEVIPNLPADLDAPVLIVQHMPKGFTASFADRMNVLSEMTVKEAEEGDIIKKGVVYIAKGGSHMNVRKASGGQCTIYYSDEPNREGVKPCANYMYESLMDSSYDNIICTVMTGMGMDGTEGIRNLKSKKNVHVISQDQNTSVVYGMPKSVEKAGLSDQVVPLNQIAQEIILRVGLTIKR